MESLVKLSRFYGADEEFIIAGGGNTSVKVGDKLLVKASGYALATVTGEGFVALDRGKLDALIEADLGDDPAERNERFARAIMDARVDTDAPQHPSVESVLHSVLDERFVVHSHSTAANKLTCCNRGEQLAKKWFGDNVLWIPFVISGIDLAQAIASGLTDYRKRTGRDMPTAILLQNHGMVVSGETPDDVRSRTDTVLGTIAKHLDASAEPFGKVERFDEDEARRLVDIIAPSVRGMLGQDGKLPIVRFDDSPEVLSLVGGSDGKQAVAAWPLAADQIIYCGCEPLWFSPPKGNDTDAVFEALGQAVGRYESVNCAKPRILLVRGLGMFAAGPTVAAAQGARATYVNAVKVMAGAKQLGGIRALSAEQRIAIEKWYASIKKRSAKGRLSGRVAGKVALVTGGAQGFGLEIARHLADEGACVVLADINADGAAAAAADIMAEKGAGRAVGLAMDVCDGQSVADAVGQVVRTYGGLDLLVSNAGAVKAESVKTQSEKDFDFVTAVNYKGYFLCVQKVSPVLALHRRANSEYWSDIVQINSKSGLAGSNRNFAYAGSKFGGVGLTQSFAMELVTDGIKVNSICPGNFLDGPLWSDPDNGLFVQYLRAKKIPGAKTVEDVRRTYEAMVPMARGCRTADVMKAIYYVMEQKYETGQAIPVTGGQIMLR